MKYSFAKFSSLTDYKHGLAFSLHTGYYYSEELIPIQQWCSDNFSRDKVIVTGTNFLFKNEADMTWFLLRWG